MIESSLGILGACLPALRPIFRGFSPESVIRSIRSALSLDSLGSRHSKTGSERSKQPAKAIDQNGSEVELTGVHSLGSAHGERLVLEEYSSCTPIFSSRPTGVLTACF